MNNLKLKWSYSMSKICVIKSFGKSFVNLLFFVATLLIFTQASNAAEEKGMATLDYGMSLSNDEKQQTVNDALKNAIERWVAKENNSHFKNYEKVKKVINDKINDYILGYQLVDSSEKNGQYNVVIRAELNEPKLMSTLLSTSEKALDGERKYLTFVFVAREQVGKVARSEKQASQTKQQEQEIAKEREDSRAEQSKRQTEIISQNKTEVTYKDKILWDVSTTNEVNVAMGEVFTDADYLVVDAGLLEEETANLLTTNKFKNDYSAGDDLSSKTKSDAIQGLKGLRDPVNYLAIGTLDIEEQKIDNKTGNVSVAVTITGQVLSVFERGAAVAKVGPETIIGEGSSLMVAKNNALKYASQQVARKLVAKLSTKNIR